MHVCRHSVENCGHWCPGRFTFRGVVSVSLLAQIREFFVGELHPETASAFALALIELFAARNLAILSTMKDAPDSVEASEFANASCRRFQVFEEEVDHPSSAVEEDGEDAVWAWSAFVAATLSPRGSLNADETLTQGEPFVATNLPYRGCSWSAHDSTVGG